MIELRPNVCNICSGEVIFTSNARIYGTEYGSGKCYLCTKCGAYVGTHEPRPKEALGLLADKEMRDLKMKCHELFDEKWKNESSYRKRHLARREAYREFASKMNMPVSECHFGYFDIEKLTEAYKILKSEKET